LHGRERVVVAVPVLLPPLRLFPTRVVLFIPRLVVVVLIVVVVVLIVVLVLGATCLLSLLPLVLAVSSLSCHS
jgi:hypothetical protein